MKSRTEIAPAWRNTLPAAGLSDPAVLLDTAPDLAGLPGRLELLTKPGLAGRQRWRCGDAGCRQGAEEGSRLIDAAIRPGSRNLASDHRFRCLASRVCADSREAPSDSNAAICPSWARTASCA